MAALEKALSQGLSELNLNIDQSVQKKLIDYLHLLKKWNRHFNLTGIKEINDMVGHHLLDSLAVMPYLSGNHIIDVGTGAGLPGIVLALVSPDKRIVLLDSNGKKTRFLQQAKAELAIMNVDVVKSRVEDFESSECFDTIICRALSSVAQILEKTDHLICEHGCWLMMKGVHPQEELHNIKHRFRVHSLTVPMLKAQRHLVVVKKE